MSKKKYVRSTVTRREYYGDYYVCFLVSYDEAKEYHLRIEAVNEDWHKYEIYHTFKEAYKRAQHFMGVK